MPLSARPKITTIVNSYNYERYLAQAIRSVLDQEYENREVIVVDDGSTDTSPDIIRSFGDRIVPLFHPNLGQARTCLRAIGHATGDYIHFLDSDDFLMPGAIAAIAAECVPGVAKVQFQLQPVGPSGEIVGAPWPTMPDMSRAATLAAIARTGTYVTPPNSGNVYRRDVFALIDDIDYEPSIDGVVYLLAPLLGEVRRIGRPLGCYRYHTTNFSRHGRLDPARFALEARRHRERLTHLASIVRAEDLAMPAMIDPAGHGFVLTRAMLGIVSKGGRPGAGLLARYLRSLARERETPSRALRLAAWAVAMALGSDAMRRRLAILRSDPRSRRSIVAALVGAKGWDEAA